MKKYFSFHGRAQRLEYWGISIGLGILSAIFSLSMVLPLIAEILLNIAFIWLSLAVIARRLRDIKTSHWYMLLILVPIVNAIAGIAWGCIKSKK